MKWEIPTKPTAREAKLAAKLKGGSKFFRFLFEIRGQLFTPEFQEELIGGFQRKRDDNVPPALLAMVWLLQAYTQASDRDAVENAAYDARWQLILGTLGSSEVPFGQGSLPRFRARLVRRDLDRRLVDRTVELARETGLFGSRNLRGVLDSSPLRGAGRVEDTWNLIGRAMRNLVGAVATSHGVDPESLIEELELTSMGPASLKANLDIDWADQASRTEAFELLVEQANRLTEWVTQHQEFGAAEPPLSTALDDLATVLEQDTEPDPDGTGRRLKKGVAKDRMPSLGDKDMRHGRKSQSFKFNGYKRFFITVPGVRLVVGALAQPANVPEHEATRPLLGDLQRHGHLEGLDFDRGFLASDIVHELRERGVDIRCKPWRARNGSRFPKSRFHIDLKASTVTCPADITVPIRGKDPTKRRKASWGRACGGCALRPKCTKAKRGRSVQIHSQEQFHQHLQAAICSKEGRAALRERVVVEHSLARLQVLQGSRARYKGTRKNTMDLRRYAALNNLFEVRRHIMKAA